MLRRAARLALHGERRRPLRGERGVDQRREDVHHERAEHRALVREHDLHLLAEHADDRRGGGDADL